MIEPASLPPGALDLIRGADSLTVLTGAGISAESGIPTFREAQQGLWARFRPEDLATPAAFREHPRRVLAWYRWRIELVQSAEPNPGHLALAALEDRFSRLGRSYTLITQNVDQLHQQAGSRKVLELHGTIGTLICAACGSPSDLDLAVWDPDSELPGCGFCPGILRPDVVWFGESLDPDVLELAQKASLGADVFLAIGTSAVVQPAATLPHLAAEAGARIIEINPQPTPLSSRAAFHLPHPAGTILPALIQTAFS